MKAIVVEIRNKDVVVLSDEGNVMKIKNNNYQIGQEVKLKNNNKKLKVKLIALVASFIISFITVSGGTYAYTTQYSYVSLDVNPSIEYSINIFGKVIDVTGVNEDGEKIINNINVENKSIAEAIKDTVSEINEQGYIKDGETSEIVIATFSNNETKSEELADELKANVEKVIDENNLVADVKAYSVRKEIVLEAKDLGVTPGKLNLVEKLQKSIESSDAISVEEWVNKPVKEIIKATKTNGEEQKTKPEETINSDNEPNEYVQSEARNSEDKAKKETKSTNENKTSNIDENKDTSATSGENKGKSGTSDEKNAKSMDSAKNKSQSAGNTKDKKIK